jgi:hypothetical protein
MNRKIFFGDDSALTISISVAEEGRMAAIAYNSLLDFIEDELLEHPELSLQAGTNMAELENDLSLDELDEEEFEDEDLTDLDEDEIDEEELEDDDWEDEDENERLY